jgi:hypothetical protein
VSKQQAGLPGTAQLLTGAARHERWWTLPHRTIDSVCWIHAAARAVSRSGPLPPSPITESRAPLEPLGAAAGSLARGATLVTPEVAISTSRAPNLPQQEDQSIADGAPLWSRSES